MKKISNAKYLWLFLMFDMTIFACWNAIIKCYFMAIICVIFLIVYLIAFIITDKRQIENIVKEIVKDIMESEKE